MTVRALALACALALASSAPASAGNFWEPVPDQEDATIGEPTKRDVLILRATEALTSAFIALEQWERARNEGSVRAARQQLREIKRYAELAVAAFEQALTLDPDDASVHFWLAGTLSRYLHFYYDEQAITSKRDEVGKRALTHWAAFERLSPKDPRRVQFVRPHGWSNTGFSPFSGPTSRARSLPPYQFERSLIYTKLGGDDNFDRALDDYDFILNYLPRDGIDTGFLATALTNSAEILMAVGRLEESIDRYREGIELSGGAERILYQYGLAVALDRAGFTESALEIMADAVVRDTRPFEQMRKATVFFVPAGDVHYYYALGQESLGHCDAAIEQYEAFLRLSSTARYHAAARAHVAYLKKARRDRKVCSPAPERIRIRGWTP